MKSSAFTMIELIIVMVVAGILAAVMIPRLERDNLRMAANQVVRHIQYTQHLAMNNDIYDHSDSQWYKDRWQIKFGKTVGSDGMWSYTIYSDYGNKDGVPNVAEIANNPIDRNRKMTGGYSSGTIAYGDIDATNELNIGHEYSIKDIDFLGGCQSGDTQKWLSFDNMGRPFYRGAHLLDTPFMDGIHNRQITSQCVIELCQVSDCTSVAADKKVIIQIEPETGYVHII